ncbi:MAG: DMT family transporter [Alphaproteobacteria bacterium]|nr:DMT family transporter [Alphaproteobacteria bacterium]
MNVNFSKPSNTNGIIFVIAATFFFALGDVATKYLATRYPVEVILAVRYVLNFGLIFVFFYPRMKSRIWAINRRWLVFSRGLCLAMASLTLALALRVMPVGETIAIIYLAPFLVMLLSPSLLGEKVHKGVWIWAIAGFIGVIIILRPGAGLDPIGIALALANAGLGTVYHLLTRLLSRTENSVPLLFHSAWVGSVIFVLWSMPLLPTLHIEMVDLWVMLGLGATYSIGHYLFTVAYRVAPPAILAPINYVHLIWAGGLSFFVFGNLPGIIGLIGIGLVGFSGVAIAIVTRSK